MASITPSEAFEFVLHQDEMMWSRIQTMEAVQVATLGGSYAVAGHRGVAVGVLVLGAILTALTFGLMKRDEALRDQVRRQYLDFEWSAPRTLLAPLKGRETASLFVALMLAADVALGIVIALGAVP